MPDRGLHHYLLIKGGTYAKSIQTVDSSLFSLPFSFNFNVDCVIIVSLDASLNLTRSKNESSSST